MTVFVSSKVDFIHKCGLLFTGICQSSSVPGLLITTSTDKTMKIWDIQDNRPSSVLERDLKLVNHWLDVYKSENSQNYLVARVYECMLLPGCVPKDWSSGVFVWFQLLIELKISCYDQVASKKLS